MVNKDCPSYNSCDTAKIWRSCEGCNLANNTDVMSVPGTVGDPKGFEEPTIKDSGDRTKFSTGAVRDLRENKGMCSLMPLEVVARYMDDDQFLYYVNSFLKNHDTAFLYDALKEFSSLAFENNCTMILETSVHFEQGAKKYGKDNWRLGLPINCYIDSTLRHYFKYRRGDKDERHDRAVCWNLMACLWQCDHNNSEKEPEQVVV